MTKLLTVLALPAAVLAVAYPAMAAAPQFDTPAPVAFMEDLSSGAILYAKDADRRMPPASMAKMMTVYTAFQMIQRGDLKLDTEFEVRPETWQKWHGPQAGSTMFLSSGERVSGASRMTLHRIGMMVVAMRISLTAKPSRRASRVRSTPMNLWASRPRMYSVSSAVLYSPTSLLPRSRQRRPWIAS